MPDSASHMGPAGGVSSNALANQKFAVQIGTALAPLSAQSGSEPSGGGGSGQQQASQQSGQQSQQDQQKQQKQQQQQKQMDSVLEKLVDSQPLQGSAFKFIARCKKCGWQNMAQDEDSGKEAVKKHAAAHWPELQAIIAQGQQGQQGQQGAGQHGQQQSQQGQSGQQEQQGQQPGQQPQGQQSQQSQPQQTGRQGPTARRL